MKTITRRAAAFLAVCLATLGVFAATAAADYGPHFLYRGYTVTNRVGGQESFFGQQGSCPSGYEQLWHTWATGSGNLGGCIDNGFDVARNQNGALEAVGVGTDRQVYHIYENSNGSWSQWYSLGGYDGTDYYFNNGLDFGAWLWTRSEIGGFGGNTAVRVVVNGTTYQNRQTSPGCCWSGWNAL